MGEIYQGSVWLAANHVGFSAAELAGKGQDPTKPIGANHVGIVIYGNFFDYYLCQSSGAAQTASYSVIKPTDEALIIAGDQNLRWHRKRNQTTGRSTFGMTAMSIAAVLQEEEYRWNLQAEEQLEVYRIELPVIGGGTNANISLDLYDVDTSTVLASTTAGSIADGAPLFISTAGATVLLRLTNNSGATAAVAFLVEYGIIK